jgi:hypothetical protein
MIDWLFALPGDDDDESFPPAFNETFESDPDE